MGWYRWDIESDLVTPVELDDLIRDYSDETVGRRVDMTEIGDYIVFTSFLGLDHGWYDTVQVFETMVTRNGTWLNFQQRYTTPKCARDGHAYVCQLIREGKTEGEEWLA